MYMAKLFSVSDNFRLLCTKVGITPHWCYPRLCVALFCA